MRDFFLAKYRPLRHGWCHESDPGNAAGGRCFVSNDALDSHFARSRDGVTGFCSRGAVAILPNLLAAALQFSSAPRLFIR